MIQIYTLTNIEDPTVKKGKVLIHSRKLRSKITTECSTKNHGNNIINKLQQKNHGKCSILNKSDIIDLTLNEDCITIENESDTDDSDCLKEVIEDKVVKTLNQDSHDSNSIFCDNDSDKRTIEDKIVKTLIFIDEDSQDSDIISLNEDCITIEDESDTDDSDYLCERIIVRNKKRDIGKKWEKIKDSIFIDEDSDDSEGEESDVDNESRCESIIVSNNKSDIGKKWEKIKDSIFIDEDSDDSMGEESDNDDESNCESTG